jgi:hypothetical protein
MPLKTPFWLLIGFITILQVVTTITFYAIARLHYLQFLHANIPFYLFGASGIHLENFETETVSQSQSHIATDGQSVSKSWCRAPDFITVWQLRSCFCGAPSLTKGRVCLLYMLLALASAVFLGSESRGTCDRILLSPIWDFPFRRLLRLAGSRWRYSTPPPHGLYL